MTNGKLNLIEIEGKLCCEKCSDEKPAEVEIFHRTVSDVPNVPLYLCIVCKDKRWS